jgi:hypothetical protein
MVGTGDNSLIQRIEASNSTLLAGQTITFSFYAKRTSGTGALDVRFYYPTTADTYGAITQIGSTVVVSASPASSWTRYTVTAAIGTNITTGLQVLINNTGAATTFITGAQLELGAVATPFARAGGSIGGELALCQRYYYRQGGYTYTNFDVTSTFTQTTGAYMGKTLPVSMRVAPTSIEYGGNLNMVSLSNAFTPISSITLVTAETSPQVVAFIASASGLTASAFYSIKPNNDSTAYLGFSAEL